MQIDQKNNKDKQNESANNYHQLKKKAINSVIILGFRRIIIQIIQTGSSIILARLLFPQVFGAFAIISFVIGFFSVFCDIGFNGVIIQQKDSFNLKQLRTIFTTQFFLSILAIIIIYFTAPFIVNLYQEQLGNRGVFYLRLMSITVLLLTFKSVPAGVLERNISYGKYIIGEVGELLFTQVAIIILVILKTDGVESFVYGSIIGRTFSAVIYTLLSPWKIGFDFSWNEFRKMLPFGTSFQITQVIGQLNAATIPIFVGFVSGAAGVGFLNWAGGIAALPRAIAEIVSRVIFPVGARFQEDNTHLSSIIERTIQLTNLTSFPIVAIVIALSPEITYIVFTDKWLPGVPALYFFSLQSIFVIIGSIITNTLLAIGEAKAVRNIQAFWTILQWVLTVPLVFAFGFTGLAIAGCLVSATFFIPLRELQKHLPVSIGKHTWGYLAYSTVVGVFVFLLARLKPVESIFHLILLCFAGMILYAIILWIFKRYEIIDDVRKIQRFLHSGKINFFKIS